MPHEILANSYFIERANRTTGPAWHRLATPFDEDLRLTVVEGARASKADQIVVAKTPVMSMLQLADGDTALIRDTGWNLLVRQPIPEDPEPRVLGNPVKDGYGIIQVAEMAALLDRVNITEKWPLETMGVLGKGERTFLAFRGDMMKLRGPVGTNARDEVQSYFMIVNYTDGQHATQAGWTGVRPVCANTVHAALAAMQAGVKLIHNADVAAQLEMYVQLLAGLQRAEERSQETIEALTMYRATDGEVDDVIAAAYPTLDPRGGNVSVYRNLLERIEGDQALVLGSLDDLGKDAIRALADQAKTKAEEREALIVAANKRALGMRQFVRGLYERERGDFPEMGGLWLGVNAVMEGEDWLIGKREDVTRHTIGATFDGDGIATKTRATKTALAIAGAPIK